MSEHVATARRQLGELGTMARQTEAMERQIMQRAETLLGTVAGKMDAARAAAMSGGDEERRAYSDLVMERGHLEHVIAQARQALA